MKKINDGCRALWSVFANFGNGFTLIELLVAVMIIGILAAVAVPQYQKAVLKSRFVSMMPVAKTLAGANEVYYAEHDRYAENPNQLNITVQDNLTDGVSAVMYSDPADLSFIRVSNSSIPNAQYVVYQKMSTNFPDTTWCEAGDERAEEMCQALGGVLPEGLTGNSSGYDGWKAYLLSGTVREGDTFATAGSGEGGDNGGNSEPQTPQCEGDAPADIEPTETNPATGTATCVNGKWKYQWTGGGTYSANQFGLAAESAYAHAGATFSGQNGNCQGRAPNGCEGSTFSGKGSGCNGGAANSCADSTFSGEQSYCQGRIANACAGSIFSGEQSRCWGYASNGCTESTFSGERSFCYGDTENACIGSTFSGNKSYCTGATANGCSGGEFQAGAYCYAHVEDSCDGAKYGEDPTGVSKGIGSCLDSQGYCPTGVPVFTNDVSDWNETTGSFDYTWKGNCCNPAYMVSGECPSGIAVCS